VIICCSYRPDHKYLCFESAKESTLANSGHLALPFQFLRFKKIDEVVVMRGLALYEVMKALWGTKGSRSASNFLV
jgi:hypothetical protein